VKCNFYIPEVNEVVKDPCLGTERGGMLGCLGGGGLVGEHCRVEVEGEAEGQEKDKNG